MRLKVIKKNGLEESFSLTKLENSIVKALKCANIDPNEASKVVSEVLETLETRSLEEFTTREISDVVELVMVQRAVKNPIWLEAAKCYALARIYKDVGRDPSKISEVDLALSFNAIKLLESRYLLRDPKTRRIAETPEDMFRRVAYAIASVEKNYGKTAKEVEEIAEQFFKLMVEFKFLPNSPTLMNAGTKLGQLSACFVIRVPDDLNGIFDSLRVSALIQKSGGGVGADFSELRPKGDFIESTGGVSSGPVSFMKIYDMATEVIKEGGKRRGANMGIMHVWHPDIVEFITSKCGEEVLKNFNISVGIYDKFIEAVIEEEKWPLVNPRECPEIKNALSNNLYDIVTKCEKKGAHVKWIRAREIFEKIIYCAWKSGDPGAVFIDTINKHNPTPKLGKINATNPCGEVPALYWESCNLGSINLEKFVKEENGKPTIDWIGLAETVKLAIRFLDNVIDANKYPDPRIEEATKRTRKIGLGVMGWAHMLIKLKIPYDSPDALYLADKVMEWIEYNAKLASIELAKERGKFPAFNESIFPEGKLNFEPQVPLKKIVDMEEVSEKVKEIVSKRPKVDWSKIRENILKYGVRNATVTTIAPTGSISIIANTSSGIEPIFAVAFIRQISIGRFLEINKLLVEELRKRRLFEEGKLWEIAEKGSLTNVKWVPNELKEIFKVAHDVKPIDHVKIQAVFQRWVDNAVSKTVNLKHEALLSDVEEVFMEAWKLGCKGITVYRDKSKKEQVIYVGLRDKAFKLKPKPLKISRNIPLKLRIGKKEYHAVTEDYAGGCETCNI